MLNQLGWMDQSSKQGAYAKISNLVKNMAYPDFITNDTSLIAYYQNLTFSLTDDYVTISGKINQFNQYLNFALLDKNKVVNRIDFLSAPGTVNAWYEVSKKIGWSGSRGLQRDPREISRGFH